MTVVRDTDLTRIRYPDRGLDLLVTDRVLAILLTGPKAPGVELKAQGLGGENAVVRIGMTENQLDALLRSEASFQEERQFTNASANYQSTAAWGSACGSTTARSARSW